MYSALAQHLSSTSYQFVLRLYHAGADHLCLASDECLAIYTLDLALVWQYKLQAAVCGLDCFPGHLVVAFADAKVSVLALRNFQLETISMHYYEYSHLRTPSKTTLLASHQSLSVYYFYNSISIIDHASFTTRLVAPSDIHSSLKNIMHFVFLSGYLEPTLAILYQPVLTCTGRLGKDKDTCCLLVVIIDQHFTFPVLYNVQGLPYNCFKLQSVERPLGGLLVFSHNAMIYLDQTSVPGLAMVVNGYFDMETKLISAPPAEGEPPLPTIPHPPSVYVKMNCINDFKSLSISLDGSCAVFVSPDIFLLVLRNGEMYQVDMIGDDHRSWRRKRSGVREFKIRSLGLTMCTPMSIIHLGHQKTAQGRTGRFLCVSNCADSLLVEHSTSIIEAKVEENESDDDLDDDLYGTSKQVQKQGEDGPFMYRVVGSLLCTGPIRDFCLSKPERYTTYPYDNPVDLQVVACAGQDQDGSMVIFSESIRPQILSSFQLAGVENIFSFGYPKSSAHDFIILSKGNRSSILKTGETYEQVEISGFHQTGRTINVGVIGEFIVQAYVGGLQILDKGSFANLDLNVFEEIHFENVKSCSICDPYVLILNEQGDAMLLEVTESARDIANFTDGDIQLSVVFKDRGELRLGSEVVRAAEPVRKSYAGPTTNVDHDDLYADDAIDEDEVDDPIFVDEVEMAKESKYWMFALTKQGTLKVFSLTDLVCRYELNHFDMAMNNSIKEAPETSEIAAGYIYEEMLVATLAQSCYIILRTEKMDIIVYKVTAEPIDDPEQLAVALVRIPNPHISRPPMAFTDTEGDKIHATPTSHHRRSYMSYFEQIGASLNKYEGVMIAGPRPCFLMMAMQGQSVNLRISNPSGSEFILDPIVSAGTHCLRIHPMLIDGNVNSFCPLNTAHSPLGFAYQTHKGEFKICQLPAQFNFDHDWGVCKVNLNRATQKIAYHIASSTHVLATSKPTEFSITRALYAAAVAAGVIEEGSDLPEAEKKLGIQEDEDITNGMYTPSVPKFQLELVSPVTWETVDIVQLLEGEQVLAIECVELHSTETTTGRKQYAAVATSYMRSEDLACRGRILLYEIIDVVPEPGNPQTNHKFKLYCKTDEKAPVTALVGVNGNLLASIGTKIIMYAVEEGELNGIAFLDVNIFVVSLSAVKNLILVSDIFKSVWFVCFQEDPPKLCSLGKDHYPIQTYGSQMIVDHENLGFAVTDANKNLHVLTYSPYAVQSQGGSRLVRRGEIQAGHHIASLKSVQCVLDSQMYAAIGGTAAGTIMVLTPLNEKLFKRLYSLYSRLVTQISHYAGLNPRGCRHLKLDSKILQISSSTSGPPGPRGILDVQLVEVFLSQNARVQHEIASAIGSSVDRILDDILELKRMTEYF